MLGWGEVTILDCNHAYMIYNMIELFSPFTYSGTVLFLVFKGILNLQALLLFHHSSFFK